MLREIAASFGFDIDFASLDNLNEALNQIQMDIGEMVSEKIGIHIDVEGADQAKSDLEDVKDETNEVGLSLGDLASEFGSGMKNPFKTIFSALDGKGDASPMMLLGAVTTGVLALGAALGAAVAGTGWFVKSTAEKIHALRDEANVAGANIEAYQKMSLATSRAGIAHGTFSSSLNKITRELLNAEDAGSEASKSFIALGIETKGADGSIKDSTAVMNELRLAYQNADDKTAVLTKANKLLGRSSAELIPFLKQTNEEYDALNEQAEANGLITEAQAKVAMELNDEFDNMSKQFSAVGATVMQALAPAFTVLIRGVELLLKGAKNLFKAFMGDTSIEDWAFEFQESIIKLWNRFANFVNNIIAGVKDLVEGFADTDFLDGWGSAFESIQGFGESLMETLGNLMDVVWELAKPLLVVAGILVDALTPAVGLLFDGLSGLLDILNFVLKGFGSFMKLINAGGVDKLLNIGGGKKKDNPRDPKGPQDPGFGPMALPTPTIQDVQSVQNTDIQAVTNVGGINIHGVSPSDYSGVQRAVQGALKANSGTQQAAEKFKQRR
jgi:hypothetical protein